MLNVSRMPMIRPGWSMRVEPNPEPLLHPIQITRGVSLDRRGWVQPCKSLEYEDLLG